MESSAKITILIFFASCFGIASEPNGKCGTWNYIRSFEESKGRLELVTTGRPTLQRSILTPSGKFRIHFDTAGIHMPVVVNESGAVIPNTTYQTYIDTLAIIADSVWNAEITHFGFPAPASDDNRGGGNEYDIYVMDLGSGLFGETVPEYDFPLTAGKTNEHYTSFIRVDNDFGAGYRTKGITALKVTCAHEFQHAIQVSSAGLWTADFYFYEFSAEAFEPIVFPDVKDYIFDVKTYFSNISSIPLFSKEYPGYERAIFGLFLMKRHGISFMRNLWNEISAMQPVPALKKISQQYQTTVENAYAEFSDWNFFTGLRADTVNYYPDAVLFPPIKYDRTVVASSVIQTVDGLAKTFSTRFVRAYHGFDSTDFILSVMNIADVESNSGQNFHYQLQMASQSFSGLPEIRPNLFASFATLPASDLQFWKYRVQTSNGPYVEASANCFPNPFNPRTSRIFFSTPIGGNENPTISIFSTSMDLIYSGPLEYGIYSGKSFPSWNGTDTDGKFVSSGIYFYYIKGQSTTSRGKFAVIR